MYSIVDELVDELEREKDLLKILTSIHNKIRYYFNSPLENKKSRKQTYSDNTVVDETGQIIGTKISALKGKNISQCSEK